MRRVLDDWDARDVRLAHVHVLEVKRAYHDAVRMRDSLVHHLLAEGFTRTAIARALGVGSGMVSSWSRHARRY